MALDNGYTPDSDYINSHLRSFSSVEVMEKLVDRGYRPTNEMMESSSYMSIFSNEDKISLLKDLVAIKSVNGNEIEVATYLKDVLNKHQIEAEVIEVEGRRILYKVSVYDANGIMGEGTHERFVIDPERFMAKLG